MTYFVKNTGLDMSVAIHPYSTISGTTFVFSTPSVLGDGITRPSSTTFQLDSGRHYYLTGSIHVTTNSAVFIDAEFQFYNVTTSSYVGAVGAIRASGSNTYSVYRKNPMRRSEACVMITDSMITGSSVTLRLDRISVSSTSGLSHALNTTYSEPSVVIMSTPA